ncbi:MAG: MoaD/ThiS family protein [Cyclobacteriaceae bacterium]|nr:MoaD/ThiS family protein [Cyclobacteriaceae bacterium]
MKLKVKAFGITREIMGANEVIIDVQESATVGDFKAVLFSQYPRLKALTSLFIAVNHAYAEDDEKLTAEAEIALIPPVAGG